MIQETMIERLIDWIKYLPIAMAFRIIWLER